MGSNYIRFSFNKRKRERVATSQEILKNKMYSEKFNIQKKEMEDLLLRGAMKKLENKQVAKNKWLIKKQTHQKLPKESFKSLNTKVL